MLPAILLSLATSAMAAPAGANSAPGIPGDWNIKVDKDNYFYTESGSCKDGCFVKVEVSNQLMHAYALGSSGTGQPFLQDTPYYPVSDTIF